MRSGEKSVSPATTQPPSLYERLDNLYEFERAPVTRDRLESGRHFAAVFAGEHVAGTEFVIGALFVSWGVGTRDLILGLLLGNLLAVLAWTFMCAPIAVETRLTLYWYLRRIAGPVVTAIYNVVNAILFCGLAGAMITVSASAVRIPFGIPPQTLWYPRPTYALCSCRGRRRGGCRHRDPGFQTAGAVLDDLRALDLRDVFCRRLGRPAAIDGRHSRGRLHRRPRRLVAPCRREYMDQA